MLQNPCKTFGFMKNMVYKIPPGGGGKPYSASGLMFKHILAHLPTTVVPTKSDSDVLLCLQLLSKKK